MPVYTCTTAESTLTGGTKAALAGGRPAQPLLINGWVREGHPEDATTVLVVFQGSPAHYAVEGGRVLPAPGEEAAWLAGSEAAT